ncbi:MAG TPA: enoyl-CoA hydratase/isomerase family protein [Myxococcaceae bacterium]|nr:enoyl-CoA hydratase/isomerase family protein [Myxococcaceae bacterium]
MFLDIRTPASGVRALLLDRPAAHNALALGTVRALESCIEEVARDRSVRAVVLGSTTAGTFCAGADLTVSDAERAEVSDRLYALYGALIGLPVPVIAAVDGAAVGGGAQLVLAADVRIGSAQARIRFVGPGHGLAVGLWGLPAAVGRGRALDIVLSQRFLSAAEAVVMGLLDRMADDPFAEAVALGSAVCALDPAAVERAKRLIVDWEHLGERLADERAGNFAAFTGRVG